MILGPIRGIIHQDLSPCGEPARSGVCVYITRPRILHQAHRHAVAKLIAECGRLLELLDQLCLLRIRSSAPIGRTTNLYSSSAARTLHLSRRMPAEQSHTGLTLKTNYQAHEPIQTRFVVPDISAMGTDYRSTPRCELSSAEARPAAAAASPAMQRGSWPIGSTPGWQTDGQPERWMHL